MKVLKDYGLLSANKVFVIAEIGLNHNGNLDMAKKLIDSVAKTGADAVKFQTYVTEKRVPKDSPIFDILKKCELPYRAFKELKDYAARKNLVFFSTPFDEESLCYLEEINCPIYKVASFDVTNLKFLRKITETKKTIIMSVGMAQESEIKKAFKILRDKTKNIVLMHCISSYPTKEEDANLSALFSLRDKFDCVIGYSDHTSGIEIPLYAVFSGAQVIEKHYKIDSGMKCVDALVSITEKQMQDLIVGVRKIEKILGDGALGIRKSEEGSVIFRRFSR